MSTLLEFKIFVFILFNILSLFCLIKLNFKMNIAFRRTNSVGLYRQTLLNLQQFYTHPAKILLSSSLYSENRLKSNSFQLRTIAISYVFINMPSPTNIFF